MEEQTHVLPPKEHPKPAKDPKRQEAGRKGAKARKRKRDTLLAELAAAKEKVQHAHDTDVVVPKEMERMQHAHNMTEGTHSVPPQDNKENTLWPIVLLGGGVVAIIVFYSKRWRSQQGCKEATVSCERPVPQQSPTPRHTRGIFEME